MYSTSEEEGKRRRYQVDTVRIDRRFGIATSFTNDWNSLLGC